LETEDGRQKTGGRIDPLPHDRGSVLLCSYFCILIMAVIFDQVTVNQVQQANDIVDIIGEHISLSRKGREMVGLCPFHDDHRPSLYVNPVKQIFKCFACGAGGSVLTFVQMRENLTFPQAVERLAERVGIKLKTQNSKLKTASQEVDPNQLAKVNSWAAKYFQNNFNDLKKGEHARNYIAERRITPENAKIWQLGLALDSPDDLLKAAKRKNIPTKLLQQAGLVTGQQQDKFVNRLMFPIADVTGRVIGFGGRQLVETNRPGSGQAGAKYINSPTTALFEKSNSLYGLQNARHKIASTGVAVVVEGYTDCIMAHQFGCENVIATLGTSFTFSHGRVLRRYAKKVILIFDNDAAGIEAANRALEVCLSQRIDIKFASVPEGKDPCDFLLAAGRESFERLIEGAVDVFQFKWNRLMDKFGDDETFTGRKAAIDEYLQTIATSISAGSLSPIDGGLIVNRLSKIIGVETKEINAELRKRLARAARITNVRNENKKVQSADYGDGLFAAAQRELLEVLLNKPRLYEDVRQKISADDFDVPILKQIATILFETLSADGNASLQIVLANAESVRLGGAFVELAEAGEQKGNFESRLSGALDVLQRCQAQKTKNQLKATENQAEFLRCVSKNAVKQNRHNLGMM
jgi:DNA primase